MTETQMQQLLIDWTQLVRQKYPELALIYHCANERKCSAAEGVRLKRMGVKPGVPDLFLPVARGGYHGLYMELKTATGRASDAQKWWLERLEEQGYKTVIVRSVNQGMSEMEGYLNDTAGQ